MKPRENFFIVFRPEKQNVSPVITQVYIELSSHCNLSCKSCVRNSIVDFRKAHFSRDLMRKLLPMLEALRPERIVLLGFGEALCNPHVRPLLSSLRGLDTRIVLVTNATFLNSDMSSFLVQLPLDELFVSWDDDIGGSGAVIRPGIEASDFKRNIETLARMKAASGSDRPLLGLEMVATKSSYRHLAGTVEYGRSIGIESFIVTNLYPYSEAMSREILYDTDPRPPVSLKKLLRREIRRYGVRTANQSAQVNRRCPFMEKGTLFITARGEIAPCPELAYTHPAYYFGYKRMHNRFIAGSLATHTLEQAWNDEAFAGLREKFRYYDFPNCVYCYRPDMCYKRTVEHIDCYWNETPCGECLWAKDIIICP